jgi:hypothetical protein
VFGLAVSHDSGQSWTPAVFQGAALPYTNMISIDGDGTVLVGAYGGAFLSTNGVDWRKLDAGLDLHPTDTDVESVAASGGFLYAGTGGGGVFVIPPARVHPVPAPAAPTIHR